MRWDWVKHSVFSMRKPACTCSRKEDMWHTVGNEQSKSFQKMFLLKTIQRINNYIITHLQWCVSLKVLTLSWCIKTSILLQPRHDKSGRVSSLPVLISHTTEKWPPVLFVSYDTDLMSVKHRLGDSLSYYCICSSAPDASVDHTLWGHWHFLPDIFGFTYHMSDGKQLSQWAPYTLMSPFLHI